MNLRFGFCSLAITLGLISTTGSGIDASTIYDVAADFSPSNPNGVWSFGAADSIGGVLTLFTSHRTIVDTGGGGGSIDYLSLAGLDFPSVFHNGSSLPYDSPDPGPGLAPGQLALHADNAKYSVARLTVAANDAFQIVASFYGVTSDTTDVHILVNGLSVFSASHSGFDPGNAASFSQTVGLSTGDTIEFVVGSNGNGNRFDWVGLDVRISAVPEPASLAMLALGGAAIGMMAARSRRTA